MSSSETKNVSQNNHLLKKRKRVDSKEDNYRRDSFEDRFCDDLSEVLLQFLPKKDKFRLECVSKQFQRNVFQSLNELILDESDVWVTQKWKHSDVGVIHILETLAKKFQRLDCLQKLKSLSITFRDLDLRPLLPALKAFPALKRLDLWTDFDYWRIDGALIGYDWFDLSELLTFEAFKGLSNIIHLTLHLNLRKYSNERLNEKILKHIDINLPNLQYLEFKDIFDTTPEGVKKIADILSRLSRLETLKLKFKSGVDFKPIEEQITEKCRKNQRNRL